MSGNFGDFQMGVYADALNGVNSRFPFDFRSIERKAAQTLPEWVYRYVSAAAGDGRTQQANIDAFSHYGIIPRMMVSPPQRDLSIVAAGVQVALAAFAVAAFFHPIAYQFYFFCVAGLAAALRNVYLAESSAAVRPEATP